MTATAYARKLRGNQAEHCDEAAHLKEAPLAGLLRGPNSPAGSDVQNETNDVLNGPQ